MSSKISRRQFSRYLGHGTVALGATSILGISSLCAFSDNTASPASADRKTETLVRYAYCILPLLEPSHPRYRAVADRVFGQASQVPQIASMVEGGISALNAAGKGDWLNLPAKERVGIIRALKATPFFGYLHWNTSEIVMRDPALWRTLGYQGSSIEHGGYLHRGFDDIDWLPQANKG
jgi:hypothetical protein